MKELPSYFRYIDPKAAIAAISCDHKMDALNFHVREIVCGAMEIIVGVGECCIE